MRQLQFDLCMSETLRERVRVTIKITGHLHIYRFCDDVWTFVVENAELTMGGGVHIKTDVIKVVACTARSASLGA